MKKYISKGIAQLIAGGSLSLLPLSAFAAVNNLCDLAKTAVGYFNMAIEVIVGLAVVVFVFNIYRYFFMNKENKERGMYLLWSIVGFAVIICFWGLVNLVANTFNFNNSTPAIFGNMFGGNGSSGCGSSGSITQPNISNGGSITQPNVSNGGSYNLVNPSLNSSNNTVTSPNISNLGNTYYNTLTPPPPSQ